MIGVTHREPSVLQVDAVSVESESVSRERTSIRVGDLVGGEWGAGARDWARDRQLEGGLERPVDGHGALEGGVQTSMSTKPPRGPSIAVHITGASRSDYGSDPDSSNDSPPATDTVTCPFSRGERRRPMASYGAVVQPVRVRVTIHAFVRGDMQPPNGCPL